MRWISRIVGMGICLGMAAGCGAKVFLHKDDFQNAHQLLPGGLDEGQPLPYQATLTPGVPRPADVNNASRPPRHMTLQEALAIALENGSTGGRSGAVGSGQADDNLVSFSPGSSNSQTDKLRVLSMNPAIAFANLESSLSRFDPLWVSAFGATNTDNLVQGLTSFSNGTTASASTSIVKAFSSGGVASVGFSTDYRMLSQPPTSFGIFNPFYTARTIFSFEQPLLQNAGVQINQLLNRTPGVAGSGIPGEVAGAYNSRAQALSQGPNFTGVAQEGILVARLRLDGQRSEFERNVNSMLVNVEAAYWNLYAAYGQLYAYEEVLRVAHRSWSIFKSKFDAGAGKGAEDYYPALAQYEEFRGNRLSALGDVLDKERQLRRILGLPTEDGTRLVPITPPTLVPFVPDWDSARQEALMRRPELSLARDNLRTAQYNLIVAQNFLKPDLRFYAQYSPVGFGTRLDGDGTLTDAQGNSHPDNAWRSLSSNHFNDWKLGLNLTMPLGFRLEYAQIRSARLALAQAFEFLKDQEDRATSQLQKEYQKLAEFYRLIEAHRAERKAYAEAVDVRYKKVIAGQLALDSLLDSTRRLAAAQIKEYDSIAQYNTTVARFEWAKGTIMQHDNVHIGEGPLPSCATIRAVEHEAERSKALVLCEKQPDSINLPGRCIATDEKQNILTISEQFVAPPVPANVPEAKRLFNPQPETAPPRPSIPTTENQTSQSKSKSVLVEMEPAAGATQAPNQDIPSRLPQAPELQMRPVGLPGPIPNLPTLPNAKPGS